MKCFSVLENRHENLKLFEYTRLCNCGVILTEGLEWTACKHHTYRSKLIAVSAVDCLCTPYLLTQADSSVCSGLPVNAVSTDPS